MSKVKLLVQWFDNNGVQQFPDGLSDVERINITKNQGSRINSADMFLTNPIIKRSGSDGNLYTKYVNTDTGLPKFNESDSIKIYAARLEDNRAIDTSNFSNDLIMSAEVKEINFVTGEKSTKLKLSCVDKSYKIFNALWSKTYQKADPVEGSNGIDATATAPTIIQNVIRAVSALKGQDKEGFDDDGKVVFPGKYAVDARLDIEGGFIETTRNDATGTAFPNKGLGRVFKPVYEWLDELSTLEFTNDFDGGESQSAPPQDRKMLYYVDELNRFHWFYPKDGATTTLTTTIASTGDVTTIDLTSSSGFSSSGRLQVGAELFDYTGISTNQLTGVVRTVDNTVTEAHAIGDTAYSSLVIIQSDNTTGNKWLGSNLKYATFDVVNAVIFNAGDDMNGSGILGLFYDETSASPDLKMVYKAWTHIARDFKKREVNLASEQSPPETTITHTDADEYAFPADYDDYGSGKALPNWNPGDATITTDSTFNTSFRDGCIALGKGLAGNLTKGTGSPRWRGTINLQFRRYTAGDLPLINSPLSGVRNKHMRTKRVQYKLSKASNRVTLTLEEDEKKRES